MEKYSSKNFTFEEYLEIFGKKYVTKILQDKEKEYRQALNVITSKILRLPKGEQLACFNENTGIAYERNLEYCNYSKKRIKSLLWSIRVKMSIIMGQKIESDSIDIQAVKSVLIEYLMPSEPKRQTRNRNYYICPLHKETDPSFVIYKKTNSYYCHGCQEGGDIIELYIKLNNLDRYNNEHFKRACIDILKLR